MIEAISRGKETRQAVHLLNYFERDETHHDWLWLPLVSAEVMHVSRCFAASGKISTFGEFELGLAAVTERAISLIPFFPHASHRSRRRRFLTAAAPSFPSLPTVPYCELLFAARLPVDLWTCAPLSSSGTRQRLPQPPPRTLFLLYHSYLLSLFCDSSKSRPTFA